MVTTARESGNGSGRSRTALTTLKMAVFAPMPRVSTASAETVKPGLFRRTRRAWRSEGKMPFIGSLGIARGTPGDGLRIEEVRFGGARVRVRDWDAVFASRIRHGAYNRGMRVWAC